MNKDVMLEHRSTGGELRASAEDGVIEGYIAVWDTVDSYNSRFQRGAFTKTLRERASRVKVLWNHEQEVIGRPLELREDDHGVFFRGQLILSVPRARETFELIKAAAVDTFSFGFRAIKDKWVDGVRVITEVMLMEVSPVIFEANSNAVITGVRTMPDDKRATNYAETYAKFELSQRGYLILNALNRTLDDIWWGDSDVDQTREQVSNALAQFSADYARYADDVLASETRAAPGNDLQRAFRKHLAEAKMTPLDYASSTSLTMVEVQSLLDGKSEVEERKLAELPDEVRKAVKAAKADKVARLCDELRNGLEPAEIARLRGLLPSDEPDVAAIISTRLAEFRASLVR